MGALAVALGIGVAVANGGVANATTDPDQTDTANTGNQDPDNPTVDDPGTDSPAGPEGPETPAVVINGVDHNDNEEDETPQRRVRPRVMILDVLRGANFLGARRTEENPGPAKQPDVGEEKQAADPNEVVGSAKFAAPAGSDPVKQALPGARALHQSIGAVTASTPQKIVTSKVLPGPTKTATVVETLTTHSQRQAATVTGTSALAIPTVEPVAPKPGHLVISLLSTIGLRPDAFPPSSPLAPIGQVLEFVYAGLRRFDHTFFNETPTATPLIVDTNTNTGVVTGRVATDYEGDALVYRVVDAPDEGEVVFNPDGTFTYTPDRNETHAVGETDEFTVVVSDRTNFHLHLLSPGWHETTVTVSNIPVVANNTVIDTVDDAGATILRPEDLAISRDGSRVYITDSDANKVHVIDTETNEIIDIDPTTTAVDSISVGDRPEGLAVVEVGGKEYLYVANWGDGTVSIVDTTTYAVVSKPLDPPNEVLGLGQVAAAPDGSKVYVTGFYGMYTIDTAGGGVTFISLRDDPLDSNRYDIAVTPNGQFAYAPDFAAPFETGDINVINLGTGAVTKIDAAPDQFIEDVVISPDGRYVYMTGESLIVLDTTTNTIVARNTDIGDGRGLTISPDGTRLYVTQINFDRITVVDTATLEIVDDIPVDDPWNVAVTPDGTRAYVIGFATPRVSVIALQTPTDPAIEV
ncbi:Ig-like domain-containing protein [Mycolicibacterium stellerae]|uniref:Ig-like domain-containing protein n=1 Tax=Mycolicibacterium stellerae TaxID=2358193 RepID=UPI000F0AFBDD|nr:Ig-like domain-containing protein [Mycolicibacterium stellerae]